jgi:hypothetical protein
MSNTRDGASLRFVLSVVVLIAIGVVGRTAHAQALAIAPPSATVAPLGTQTFTASGGSSMGYVFSLSANPSGGTITILGAYTAGATSGTVDEVLLTDSAMNTVMASVTVGSSVQIMPLSAMVAPGAMQTFIAAGGTPPYTWTLTTDNSGPSAGITAMGGVYTAGMMAGMDIITVKDSTGATATATITVTVMMVGIGADCMESATCPTGATCVDGVCCSSACSGQCQACNTANMVGQCVTITGPAVGTRPPCPQSDPNNVCTSKMCDGTSATSCTSFVNQATTCGVASCIDGIGTPGAVCEGNGVCQAVAPASCGEFACVSNACAKSCLDNSECSPGNYCKVAGLDGGKCIKPPPIPDGGGNSADGSLTAPLATSSGCSVGRPGGGDPSFLPLVAVLGTWGLTRRQRGRRQGPGERPGQRQQP